jgi:hypothetical protein
VPARVFLKVACVVLAVVALGAASPAGSVSAATPSTTPPTTVESAPADTINEFLPEDRSIGECISAVPKPGCGSDARGGWHQYLVAIAMLAGLVVVGWRVVAGVRRRPASG